MIKSLTPIKDALSWLIDRASCEDKRKWEKLMLLETDWEQLESWRIVLKTPFLMTKAFEKYSEKGKKGKGKSKTTSPGKSKKFIYLQHHHCPHCDKSWRVSSTTGRSSTTW